jgi:hypothetical protein
MDPTTQGAHASGSDAVIDVSLAGVDLRAHRSQPQNVLPGARQGYVFIASPVGPEDRGPGPGTLGSIRDEACQHDARHGGNTAQQSRHRQRATLAES